MNAWPVSRPITTSSSQYARDVNSSAMSLRTRTARSRERKEDLLDVGVRLAGALSQIVECAARDEPSIVEQQQPVADAHCVVELVNGQDERATALCRRSQCID